jgi:hypothetical protein
VPRDRVKQTSDPDIPGIWSPEPESQRGVLQTDIGAQNFQPKTVKILHCVSSAPHLVSPHFAKPRVFNTLVNGAFGHVPCSSVAGGVP